MRPSKYGKEHDETQNMYKSLPSQSAADLIIRDPIIQVSTSQTYPKSYIILTILKRKVFINKTQQLTKTLRAQMGTNTFCPSVSFVFHQMLISFRQWAAWKRKRKFE